MTVYCTKYEQKCTHAGGEAKIGGNYFNQYECFIPSQIATYVRRSHNAVWFAIIGVGAGFWQHALVRD